MLWLPFRCLFLGGDSRFDLYKEAGKETKACARISALLQRLTSEPGWFPLFVTQCNADKRTRNAATRCVLRAYNAAKCAATPLGELTALPKTS